MEKNPNLLALFSLSVENTYTNFSTEWANSDTQMYQIILISYLN